MITLTKDNETAKVQMVLTNDGLTWTELSNEFVNFLQACGYIVNGYEVGDHLCTEYAFQKQEEKQEQFVLEYEYKPKRKKKHAKRKSRKSNARV
jgi:hypothetical protein